MATKMLIINTLLDWQFSLSLKSSKCPWNRTTYFTEISNLLTKVLFPLIVSQQHEKSWIFNGKIDSEKIVLRGLLKQQVWSLPIAQQVCLWKNLRNKNHVINAALDVRPSVSMKVNSERWTTPAHCTQNHWQYYTAAVLSIEIIVSTSHQKKATTCCRLVRD